jgi:hypothetical protein
LITTAVVLLSFFYEFIAGGEVAAGISVLA